tara:strand:+ start:32 stop:304 length:273 start_codon:yes stop_codon:yes gene_type:complete
MKKLFLLLFIPLFFACALSTEELAKEIKQSMIEQYADSDFDIEVVDFSLVHKGGNEYKGFLELNVDGNEYKRTVEVIYDGDSYSWEVLDD